MSAAEEFLQESFAPTGTSDCVAFVGDNQTHDTMKHALSQLYNDPVVRDGGASKALEFLGDGALPKVMIIDIGDGEDPLSALLTLSTAIPEGVRLIGIGTINDITLYRELTEAGILDYLVKPVTERQIISALERFEQNESEVDEEQAVSSKIAVIGARGGAGASSLSVNLSWLLAEEFKQKTMLLDLDLWFGTIALSLDLEPTRGLREALENPARIDSLFISSSTAKISENLSVMAAEEALAGEMVYYSGATEILIDTLSHSMRNLVMDLPRGAFRMRHPVLQSATTIALVTPPNLAGLRDSIRLLGAIDDAGSSAKVKIVVNQAGGPQQAMSVSEFEKALGHKVDIEVPDEPKIFKDATNNGKPAVQVAPRSKTAKALMGLASEVAAEEAVANGKNPLNIFGRLLKRG